MNCPTQEDLNRFHDGELSSQARGDIETHLHTCQVCYDHLSELSIVSDLIKNASMPQPTIAMMRKWQGSMRNLQEESVRRITGWLTAAASIVLAISLHLALSKQANATIVTLADWEPAAIGLQSDNASLDQATAQWIATDLSRSTPQTGVKE